MNYKLFNEKCKTEFIDFYKINNNLMDSETLYYSFDKTYELENRFNKDLFEFNKEELMMLFYKHIKTSSEITKCNIYITHYIDYAIIKGWRKEKVNFMKGDEFRFATILRNNVNLVNQIPANYFSEFDYEYLLNKKLKYDRNSLYLSSITNLSYLGLGLKDLANLTIEDVVIEDEQAYLILKNNTKFYIELNLANKLLQCNEISEVIKFGDRKRIIKLKADNKIFRTSASSNASAENFYRIQIFRDTITPINDDNVVSNQRLAISGIFNRMLKKYKSIGLDLIADILSESNDNSNVFNEFIKSEYSNLTWQRFKANYYPFAKYLNNN